MFGAVVTGFAAIFSLQVINPDDLIVRTNTELAKSGKSFDVDYAAKLSEDAVPAIIDALPLLNDVDQKKIFDSVIAPKLASQKSDWRTWSWSRHQAGKILEEYQKPFQNIMNSWHYGDSPVLSYSNSF